MWQDQVDWETVERRGLTEEDVWQAIADDEDLDYFDIADGDILDYL
jgi:uncharacterized ubiquitin-like protein YukD